MPRKILPDQGVTRLRPPKDRRVDYADKFVPGLILRITPHGVKSWSLLYRITGERGTEDHPLKGKQRRLSLGKHPVVDLKTARTKARKALDDASNGIDPALKQKAKIATHRAQAANTFGRVVAEFIEKHAKPNTRKWKATQRTFEIHVLPRWGDSPLVDIRRRDAIRLLDDIVAENKPHAATNVRKHCKTLFNWAIGRDLIETSPFDHVPIPVKPNKRMRSLKPEEIAVVWPAAEQLGYPFGTLHQLLLLTGQRRDEIAKLRWAWCRLDDDVPCLEIPDTYYKSGRPHVVPLSTLALEILGRAPRFKGGEFVLSTTHGKRPISGYSQAKARLDKNVAGGVIVEPWQLHDLRRTVVSGMAQLNISHEIRERVVGHALSGLDGTYNQWDYLPEKQRALETWAGQIRNILGNVRGRAAPPPGKI